MRAFDCGMSVLTQSACSNTAVCITKVWSLFGRGQIGSGKDELPHKLQALHADIFVSINEELREFWHDVEVRNPGASPSRAPAITQDTYVLESTVHAIL